MDARMKAVLSSCILRCLLGRRSTRPKRNDIKEQQRLPKPAPMTERRRRGPLFLIFIIFRIMQVIRKIGERKSPLFRVSGLSGGSWAFWAGWAVFSRFVRLCYLNALLYMFLSAFLFYDRPAVVCKNFSDFNSYHFLIPAAHIFQERSICAFPSIYPSWSFWFFS